MSRRSGLLVPVPAAEPLVHEHRARWDPPAAFGVPAHVTVLYPFAPPDAVDETVLRDVADTLEACSPFGFTLAHVERFEDDVLYLAPEPADPFVALTDAIAARFPAYPPYAGRFAEVIPHLTVADTASGPPASLAAELRAGLPVAARAAEVWLMEEARDGTWSTRAVFPLRG